MKPRTLPRSIPQQIVTPTSRGHAVTILKAGDVARFAGFDPGDTYAISDWARDYSAIVTTTQSFEEAAREALDSESLRAIIV